MKRTRVDSEMVGDFRITKFNDGSAAIQYLAKGEIISINDKTPAGENSNGNEFYVATVKATIEGKERTGNAIIWGNQLETDNFEGTWPPGTPVIIVINDKNITPDGEVETIHKGKSSIEFTKKSKLYLREQWELENETSHNQKSEPEIQLEDDVEQEILTPADLTTDKKVEYVKEVSPLKGCITAIIVFTMAFGIMGLILAPFSFLGEILYPIWGIGGILIAKFIEPFLGFKK